MLLYLVIVSYLVLMFMISRTTLTQRICYGNGGSDNPRGTESELTFRIDAVVSTHIGPAVDKVRVV